MPGLLPSLSPGRHPPPRAPRRVISGAQGPSPPPPPRPSPHWEGGQAGGGGGPPPTSDRVHILIVEEHGEVQLVLGAAPRLGAQGVPAVGVRLLLWGFHGARGGGRAAGRPGEGGGFLPGPAGVPGAGGGGEPAEWRSLSSEGSGPGWRRAQRSGRAGAQQQRSASFLLGRHLLQPRERGRGQAARPAGRGATQAGRDGEGRGREGEAGGGAGRRPREEATRPPWPPA